MLLLTPPPPPLMTSIDIVYENSSEKKIKLSIAHDQGDINY